MHSRISPLVSFVPEPDVTLFDMDPSARLRPLKRQNRCSQNAGVPQAVVPDVTAQPEVAPVSNAAIMDA